MRLALLVLLAAAFLFGGCGSSASDPVDPSERAVAIATTACGDASKTVGSGVVVGPGRVLTAAHVVVGATSVNVATGSGTSAAQIVVVDATRDLAILTVEPDLLPTDEPVELAAAGPGDPLVALGATSGVVDLSVDRVLTLRADNVRQPGRTDRSGYELDASLLPGDSGAGVFNNDGSLVAVVFSGPADRDGRVFAVSADEIEAALAAPPADWRCDPEESRVRQSG